MEEKQNPADKAREGVVLKKRKRALGRECDRDCVTCRVPCDNPLVLRTKDMYPSLEAGEGYFNKREGRNVEMGETGDINLEGYKEKVKTSTKGFLFWEKDLLFKGMTQTGYEIEFDARVEWGCMPTESLLLSLAGCMGIDVVSFLQKMKVDLHKFKLDIDGERNPTPPQYYREITMHLHLTGKGIKERQVERAVSLSQEKYCSVYHSLRKDLVVKVGYTITDVEEPHEVK